MSRLAKKPIIIPEKVEVKNDNNNISVKGPLGELKRKFVDGITVTINEKEINVTPSRSDRQTKMMVGTSVSHLKNMIEGVTNGFKKKLIIEGVGYKAKVEGKSIVLGLGFSHPVNMPIPEGVKVEMEKNDMTISGIDKEVVGEFCAKVRSLKKPEPYKGKGIRYEGEVIRRKAGKKTAAAA